MKAVKYEKDAVLIQDGNIKVWIDIWIENEDVICDWNKYIFLLTDSKDVELKNWQENIENFLDATSVALETLVKFDIISQNDNDKWHQTENYFNTKGSIDIV